MRQIFVGCGRQRHSKPARRRANLSSLSRCYLRQAKRISAGLRKPRLVAVYEDSGFDAVTPSVTTLVSIGTRPHSRRWSR